ncbi:High affinity cysteine transporter [Meyerozyma sp. JA9]|nr:High affinity cysteine transporter [Meyerozyma sp. JA9]
MEKKEELISVHSGADAKVVAISKADETLHFMREYDSQVPEITPAQDKKLFRKVLFRVLGMTFLVNMIMYMDKATLSYSSILGLWEATGIDQNEYNNINTLFYVGFLVGQLPSPYILQKFPLSKVLFGIVVLWSMLVFLICAAYNYPGVLMLRFFLGFVEASAIPLLTTTNGMFMTKDERATIQPIFYASCMASPIPIGFIAYGIAYLHSGIPGYKVLQIVIGGITLLLSVVVWFFYPDNPAQAKFLSIEEKVWVIRRVQRTQLNTIEQKHVFKRAHAIEALKDPISWLITGFFLLQQLANNLTYQQTLLYEEMGGVSNLGSTLVTVAGAGYAVLWALFASAVMFFFPNTTCFCVLWSTLPAWVGSVAAVTLDIKNSIGMLAVTCMASSSFGVPWICAFGLAASTAGASYSKRLTRNSMVMIAYSVANIISPQLWQSRDAPRYVPAWIVQIVLSFTVAPGLIGIVWWVLSRRNKERLAALQEGDRIGYVEDESGNKIEVDVATLDLTDLEDKTFIYPL